MEKYVYLLKTNDDQYKIGVSINPKRRLIQLQTGNSEIIEIVGEYKSIYPYLIEKALHNQFSSYNEHGEWFNLSLNEEINFIKVCEKIDENITFLKKQKNKFI